MPVLIKPTNLNFKPSINVEYFPGHMNLKFIWVISNTARNT